MHGKMWGACDFKERVIQTVILAVDEKGDTAQQYMVGSNGVTAIRRVRMTGEQAYIPYLQIWKGSDLWAEVCQHKVAEVIFKTPNEFQSEGDDDARPAYLTTV